MSEKLIGEVIKEAAFERMRSDLENSSKIFLQHARIAFLSDFYMKGDSTRQIIIPKEYVHYKLGYDEKKIDHLSHFVGMEFKEHEEREDEKKKTSKEQLYSLSILPYVEGEKKTPAQEMWEQLVKEYQEQVRKDQAEAEQICKIVLEKLKNKDYSIKLIYNWNWIDVVVNVPDPYKKEAAERYAWKAKAKAFMAENGFDSETYPIYFEENKWRIRYKMTE